MSSPDSRLPPFAGAAIFILALIVLMLEVALTRIFSVMTYNHFTHLIIGLALLGFGAAGTVLTVSERFRGDRARPELLADCAWLLGLVTILAFLAITKTLFNSVAIHEHHDFSQLFGLLMMLVLAAVPFFAGGLCIGYLVSKSGDEINRIYFCDLIGAGLGALLSVAAINYLGATGTIFACAAGACLVAMLIAGRRNGRLRWRYPLTAVAALALCALTLYRDDAVPVPFEPSKIPTYHGGEHRWHVVARVDVAPPGPDYPSFGGALSRTWDKEHPPLDLRGVFQDGAAFTGILNLAGKTPKDFPILAHYMQACGYVLRPNGDALIIGPGGGVDVAMALYHNSKHVTAVDINPWTIWFVKNRFNDFAGGLYNRPDVDVICAEGRHFVTSTTKKFDVLQLSGVDTFSALASGAYALSENYLYTREAVADFLNALTDDGVLSFSRWLFAPPRETIRLATTAREVLESRGVEHPDQHILVLAAPAYEGRSPWADIMIKNRPFTADEVRRIREWAAPLRFDVIYDPLVPYIAGGAFDSLAGTPKYKPAECAAMFDKALRLPRADYQRFLHDYPYKITPCSDDMPFFFNYYRLSNLRHPFTATLGGDPVNRLPLGLIILLACLVQIALIGGLFILYPMRSAAAGLRRRGAFAVLVYFSAVGLGFIAVEIMVLQKLTVFLGGPVYSMAITLFSLLVFCGLGSFLAKRFTMRVPRLSGVVILLILAAAIYATTWFFNHKLHDFLSYSDPMRAVVAVLALAPVGLLMGMPFPTGVRVADRLHPPFVSWGWCVNACATVLGSVAAILAAMFSSFTDVLYAGAAMYVIALLALLAAPRPSAAPASA